MNSDNSPSTNAVELPPEEPVVDPQDYSPPPPHSILGEETRLAERKPDGPSKISRVLPIAAAGAALVAVGAVAYVKSRSSSGSSPEAEWLPSGNPLNINDASVEELMKLPHVGPVVAKRIVDGRPFKAVQGLLEVPGIGGKYFDDIAPHLTV